MSALKSWGGVYRHRGRRRLASGQEILQFFGYFGLWGLAGLALATLLFGLLGAK